MDARIIKEKLDAISLLVADLYVLTAVTPTSSPAIPPILSDNLGDYTSADILPRLFPANSSWLVLVPSAVPYLRGYCWWLLEEMARAANTKITVLLACPLSIELPGSSAHRPCNELGGGIMVDCKYPSLTSGGLDVGKMKAMTDKFLSICCPPLPSGKEWREVLNESEIRVGSDVSSLIGYGGNRHVQIDDAYHHRYDDKTYPHFHLKYWRE